MRLAKREIAEIVIAQLEKRFPGLRKPSRDGLADAITLLRLKMFLTSSSFQLFQRHLFLDFLALFF